MTITANPAVAGLANAKVRLASSGAEGFKGKLNEVGINMVDLMMWLVIAALLLAAALQGIGYYQQAAWTYQAKSDVASVRTYMEAQFTLSNNTYQAFDSAAIPSDLKLTGGNLAATKSDGANGWIGTVESAGLKGASATNGAFFNFASTQADATGDTSYDWTGSGIKPSKTAVVAGTTF